MKKLLVLNGPNLAMLGTREPEIYGRITLADIIARLEKACKEKGVAMDAMQSDVEGELVAAVCKARGVYDGIILNPAAFTHTSVAIHDAIKASGLPVVEVHLSNVYAREGYRHESITAGVCAGQICGFGQAGYLLALDALIGLWQESASRLNAGE